MNRNFLIDTNVLSELMRAQPDLQVISWFELHGEASCFTSSITKAEIFLGIALPPEGTRRNRLSEAADKMFSADFSERCLPFDNHSSVNYAKLVSKRLRIGKPVSTEDAQIAAIAITNKLVLGHPQHKRFYRN
jgi:predicted nucleic acid-binding protein